MLVNFFVKFITLIEQILDQKMILYRVANLLIYNLRFLHH